MKTLLSTQTSSKSSSSLLSTRKRRTNVISSLLAIAAALGPIAFGSNTAYADTNPPDYTNVANPLNGVSHILRDDDLVLSLANETSPAGTQVGYNSMISTNNTTGQEDWSHCNILHPNGCLEFYQAYDYEQIFTVGRFFKTQQDSVVQYPVFASNQSFSVAISTGKQNIGNPNTGTYVFNARQPLPYGSDATTSSVSAVADFNGDGFDDMLMVYSDWSSQFDSNGRARVATAKDVTDPTQGFDYGAEYTLGIPYGVRAVAAGDFNGDGHPEFAVLYIDNNRQLTVAVYSVDANRTITKQSTTLVETVNNALVDEPVQIVAGSFTGGTNVQLAIANRSGDDNTAKVRVFDFAGNYQPVLKQTLDTKTAVNRLKLVADRFAWSAGQDSLALMLTDVNDGNSTSTVEAISVDPTSYALNVQGSLDVAKDIYKTSDKNFVALDIALGNFDNHMPSPQDPTVTTRDPDLQLAIAVGYCQGTNQGMKQYQVKDVNFYNVIDRSTGAFKLDKQSAAQMTTESGTQGNVTRMQIVRADLQGRSLRLGAGYKIEADKMAMTMALAQPPMHVDYALEAGSSSNPTLVNVSFAPDKVNAAYVTSSSKDQQSTSAQTKGWGFSGKQSVGTSMIFGKTTPESNLDTGVRITETFTAQQSLDQSTSNKYGSDSLYQTTVTGTTGDNDLVFVEDGSTFVYVYEVLGRSVCPFAETSCSDSDKVPLTTMFTAPGSVTAVPVGGESAEWYQPVWENGNLLSYPGNQAQLFLGVDNPFPMTAAWQLKTDSSNISLPTTWSDTTNKEQDVTSSRLFQEDSTTTIEGSDSVGIGRIGYTGDDQLSLDFGGSDSFASLTTTATTLNSSTGLTINKGSFTTWNDYGYNFNPVVYAQSAPADYQNGADPNMPASGDPISPSSSSVYGPMRSGYFVDVTSDNLGAWWKQTYGTFPDIAFNHPNRFQHTGGSDEASNCVEVSSGDYDCVKLTPRDPANPWRDSFHQMRGLFIFDQKDADTTGDPAKLNQQGMQQQIVTVGEQLRFETRVYNYSTKAMPEGTKLHVQFWAMPWDDGNNRPADYIDAEHPGGMSIPMGTYTANQPIPPFSTDGNVPNYVIASVDLDTADVPKGYYAIWTVAWAENADGTMIQEPTGKGLSANPGGYNSPTPFTTLTGLETPVDNQWPANPQTDPATTSFGNNIGFYRQVLYVKGADASVAAHGATGKGSSALTAAPSLTRGKIEAISMGEGGIEPARVELGESVHVHATLHNTDEPMEIANVYFYDGDPARGGKAFDIDRVPYVDATHDTRVEVRYTPKTCGTHDIYVQASHHGKRGTASKVETVEVECGSTPAPEKDDGGGCTIASVGQTSSALGWLAPLGAIGAALGIRRRQRKG